MQNSRQKVIWITGASSGLGRSIALQLANSGALVIATARNRTALDELAAQNTNIRSLVCDITDAAACALLGEQLAEISPHIDQAILNAGNCEYLDFPDPDWAAVRRVMEVNFFGTVNCVELVLPLLRSADKPHLVVIASQATAAAFPRAEAYGASKAAVQYFCDCLRLDLACEQIDVSVVNPGFVDTPLTRKNDFEMPFLMDVEQAAGRVINKLDSRPRSYSFPLRLSLLLGLSKLAPGLWQKAVTAGKNSNDATRGV